MSKTPVFIFNVNKIWKNKSPFTNLSQFDIVVKSNGRERKEKITQLSSQ